MRARFSLVGGAGEVRVEPMAAPAFRGPAIGVSVAEADWQSLLPGATAVERRAPADWLLHKPAADLLMVGHAHASRAMQSIAVRVAIPRVGFERRFVVTGPSPIERMPMSGALLRDEDGETRIPPVGPIVPRRAAVARGEGDDADGELEDALLPRLDRDELWAQFPGVVFSSPFAVDGDQCAAAHMTTKYLRGDEVIELDGVATGGGPMSVRLPGLAPLVLYQAAGMRFLVGLVLDTAFLDLDGSLELGGLLESDATVGGPALELTWRGQVHEDVFTVPGASFVVAPAYAGDAPNLASILAETPRARFEYACVPAGIGIAVGDEVGLRLARQRCMHETPEPRLSLEHYVAVARELGAASAAAAGAEGSAREVPSLLARTPTATRGEVLARHGLDEDAWMLEERGWLARFSRAVENGE